MRAEVSKRAASAPTGDPITRTPSQASPSGSERFGKPIATRGDVTVYRPTRRGGNLIVPVKVTNTGTAKAFYDIKIRISGPEGFAATISLKNEVVGLYPGTSWPTEQTVNDPGKPLPALPHIEFEKYVKREPGH
ncbi:hypothetical protein AB0J38_11545 [Streptomyces sp. NPDC050095]|uniref:hypothetical protein n=1 Tax=unclassified Streptomyces TaxID=2593676 RepID=UPI0034147F59